MGLCECSCRVIRVALKDDKVTPQAKREKVQGKGDNLQKVDCMGNLQFPVCEETPPRCSWKLCCGANGLLEAEHVRAHVSVNAGLWRC